MGRRKPDSRERTLRFRFTPPPPPPPEARKPRRRRIRWLRLSVVVFLLFLLAIVSAFFGFVTAIAQDLPNLEQYKTETPAQLGGIWAKGKSGKWVKIATLRSPEARILVKPNQIDPDLTHAVVAIEDKRFFDHKGVDPTAILRALVNKYTSGSEEGGSTITQQLIKNTITGDEHSYQRKLKEAALAYQLEKRWTKEKILAEYLNTIYFGHGNYGVETAARYYFGKGANNLDVQEAALLAAIPKAPSLYDPVEHPDAARERRNLVIDQMVDQGYVSPELGAVAKATRLLPKGRRPGLHTANTIQPYFVDYVIQQLERRYGERTFTGGFQVYTTLDLAEQETAEKALQWTLHGKGPEGSLVSIEPGTGKVRAMVGGSAYGDGPGESQFNIATSGQRQPGSAFKPFVLLAALEDGIQTSTHFTSAKQLFDLGSTVWYVTNYTQTYAGSIDLKTATAESDNTVYAQLTMTVGPAKVAQTARKLGITSPLDEGAPAIGLGGLRVGVTPLEMAHAYATIANAGVRVGGSVLFHDKDAPIQDPSMDPISIERIRIPGEPDVVNRPKSVRAVSEADALAAIDALKGVINYGTGKRADIGRPAAGKTGTTSDYKDAWFAGFTPQRAAAVWVGYVDPAVSMETEFDGDAVAGGTLPALAWNRFMKPVHTKLPVEDWPYPPSIYSVPVFVDRRYGTAKRAPWGCRYGRELVLAADKVPTQDSTCSRNLVAVPDFTGMTRKQVLRIANGGGGVTVRFVRNPAAAGEEPGTVVAQTPAPLDPIEVGGVVTATVAEKVDQVVVPRAESTSYDEVSLAQAITRLRAQRFRVVVDDGATKAGVPPGTVIDQSPAAGILAVAGSVVTITVTGAYTEGVEVPDVTGQPYTTARQRLEQAGLGVRAQRDGGSPRDDDVVFTMDPPQGYVVPPDTVIELVTDSRVVATAAARTGG
jgi:penicillin-binding protein 1A